MPHLAGALVVLGLLLAPQKARADVSGWTHFGAGVLSWQAENTDGFLISPVISLDVGLGTADDAPFIIGGMFHVQPVVENGADLALLVRFATRGFQCEWFGFAIDAGPYQRFWGAKSTGGMIQGSLGGPLGLQLSLLGQFGSGDAIAFGGTLGIDFARLTLHRRHLTDWWPSPRPGDSLQSAQLRF